MIEIASNYERIDTSTQWFSAIENFSDIEIEAQKRANLLVGKYALTSEIETKIVNETKINSTTLLSAITEASLGDENSRELIMTNVATDYSERLFKSKNETIVPFEIINRNLFQNGRKNTEIQENIFQYGELNSVMLERSENEYRNAEMFDLMIEQGVTDDFDILVVSPTPTDIETREKYNFFTDTDSMSLQLMSVNGDSGILHTAFVAGKKSKNSPRHDMDAIKQVALENGVDILNASEDDLLQYVMLIPKGSLENGVTSIVEQYDNAVGGTFYGEDEPQQNYKQFAKKCQNRKFNYIVNKITDNLIANAHNLRTPQDAIELLDKLSGKEGAENAVFDKEINPAIFGKVAEHHIYQARIAFEQNKFQDVNAHLAIAKKEQTSSSCPYSSNKSGNEYDILDGSLENDSGTSFSTDEDKYGSIYFDCPKGHKNKRPKNTLIEKCQKCGCSVRC